MRQAGVLAAAGLVALDTMVSRLGEDHARARNLALGLRSIPGVILDPGTPATNMVFFDLGADVKQSAAGAGVEAARNRNSDRRERSPPISICYALLD